MQKTTPQLTIQDLSNIQSLLNLFCARGAVRAEEMTHVGLVYDNLAKFIASASAELSAQSNPDLPPADTAPVDPAAAPSATTPPQGE